MKDLINYLDRGIISLDQDLKVLRWNKWLELKTTIPESDIIGKKLSDLFPQIGNKLAYRQLERAVKQKNPLILSSSLPCSTNFYCL